MKKITFLIISLISFTGFTQEIATTESGKKVQLHKNGTYKYLKETKIESTTLKSSDIITVGDFVKSKSNSIYIINGDEKPVEVQFSLSCSLNRYSSISINEINSMISTANIKTMFQMKNRRTYVPKKVSFFFSDKESNWLIAIEYIAQNDFGATKDGTAYSTFEELGEFKEIIIP
ncbi:hypothetical protein ABGT15_12090 [Flavobacterium enshiense]|uniref:hypothetical protein n=1 Tax=Flavobacterium enshiense TaxID=1341165 RepID=UPI00345D2DBD